MMLREKSIPWTRLKYLYILPLVTIAVAAFARPEISEKTEEISVVKVNDLMGLAVISEIGNVPEVQAVLQDTVKRIVQVGRVIVGKQQKVATTATPSDTTKTRTISVVGSHQQAGGGMKKMSFYFEKAGMAVGLKNVPEGKIPLIILNGKEVNLSIANALDPKCVKSLSGTDAGEYAIKKYGDKGKYGVLEITLNTDKEYLSKKGLLEPIMIKIDPFKPKRKEEFVIGGPHDAEWHAAQAKNAALIIVDGKEVPNLGDIPVDQISDFSVLKGESAIEFYGEKGKNGVVIVTLNSSKKSTK